MIQQTMFTKEPDPEKKWKSNLRGVFCPYCGGDVDKQDEVNKPLPHDPNGARPYQQIIVKCVTCERVSNILANARTTAFCPYCGKVVSRDFGCGCPGKG